MNTHSLHLISKSWSLRFILILSLCLNGLLIGSSKLGVKPSRAAFPGENGRIPFQTSPSTHELRVINPDGSGELNLIPADTEPENPAWSPDGKQIAYDAMFNDIRSIFIADADGSNPQAIISGGVEADWSADGSKLVYRVLLTTSEPGWYLAVWDLETSKSTAITTLEGLYDQHYEPAWEPTGNRIVFTRSPEQQGEEIWIVNSDGSGLKQLTFPPSGWRDRTPEWSPDGTKIVFTRETSYPGGGQLYVIEPQGGTASPLTTLEAPESARGPAWSSDGKEIAYIPYASPAGAGIVVMDATSGVTKHITTAVYPDGQLSWQPLPGGNVFVVNSIGDDPDENLGNEQCDTGQDLPNGKDECTLRAAIEQSNAIAGKDTINFNIPDNAYIQVSAENRLSITDPVIIDGTTQPGSSRVEIHDGYLDITAGLSEVRGLAIVNVETVSIRLSEGGSNVLEGNFIGADAKGNLIATRIGGILIEKSANNRIGGADHDPGVCNRACNLITAVPQEDQQTYGIMIGGNGATDNIIQGNFISTDITGLQAPSPKTQSTES
jgi:CSLREA domain-containing protein